jgi:lipopolysaccharide transport system permease protein
MAPVAYLRYAWARRELLRQLAWSETKAGRRQSMLGLAWVFAQPAAYLLVLSAIFSRLARADSGDIPYPLFLLAGLVPWLFLAGSVSAGTGSVVGMAGLVRKVSFPRMFCPMAVMAAHLTNLLAGFVFLAGLMAYFRVTPTPQALWAVPIVLVTAMLSLGVALLFSALNVHTRDVGSVVPLLVQIWFFATPIIYPLEWVREPLRERGLLWLYRLNPMVDVVEGLRASLLRGEPPGPALAGAAVLSVAMLLFGAWVFTRLEPTFADVV